MFKPDIKKIFYFIFQYAEPEIGWHEDYYTDNNGHYIVIKPDCFQERYEIISEEEFIYRINELKENYPELDMKKASRDGFYPECCWIEPKRKTRKGH